MTIVALDRIWAILLLAVLLLGSTSNLWAQCSEVDPQPTGGDLWSVATSGNETVAVAGGSTIIRSTNNIDWERVDNDSDANYQSPYYYRPDVAFGAGIYVRVNSSAEISTSRDGRSWTQRIVPGATNLRYIAYGLGTFVVSGDPGVVWLSANGINWTSHSTNSGTTWFGNVRFAGGRFFLLGSSSGTADSRTSVDGVQWTGMGIQAVPLSLCPGDVTYANGTYYLVGVDCEGQGSSPAFIWSSTDGTSFQWTGETFLDDIETIASDGTNIVAVGTSKVVTKTGNGPWVSNPINTFAGELPSRIIWTGGGYTIVGTGGLLGRSSNGSTWQPLQTRFLPGRSDGGAAATNGRVLVLAGPYQGPQSAVVSQNSDTWTVVPRANNGIYPAAANDKFFQSNFNGQLDWSTDGLNWSAAAISGATFPIDVAFGNGKYVALDYNYRVYTSIDGHSWSAGTALPITAATASKPERILFGNGVFLVSGSVGLGADAGKSMLLISSDGITWGISRQQCVLGADNPSPHIDVAFGNGMFLGSFSNVTIGGVPASCFYRSTDGVNWVGGASAGHEGLRPLAFGNGLFVGSDSHGVIGYSSDSTNWGFVTSGSDGRTKRGAYNSGHWILPAFGTGTSNTPSVGRLLKCILPPHRFSATPASISVCAGASGTSDVGLVRGGDFSGAVALSATGAPANTSIGFSPNPVNSPTVAALATISTAASAVPGDYPLELHGSGTGTSPFEMTASLSLNIASSTPDAVTLTTPVNGAVSTSTTPTLSWQAAARAHSYTVEVATNPSFSNLVVSHTLGETTWVLAPVLEPDTTYFWRVRATNGCGIDAAPTTFSFTTDSRICTAGNLAIPDNNAAGLSSTLVATHPSIVTDLDVSVNLTHTWVGDLIVTLTHVGSGTTIALLDRPGIPASTNGCSGNDVNVVLDDEAASPAESECVPSPPAIGGTFTPSVALGAMDGRELHTTWRLNVSDHAGNDTGNLLGWCLIPTAQNVLFFRSGFE